MSLNQFIESMVKEINLLNILTKTTLNMGTYLRLIRLRIILSIVISINDIFSLNLLKNAN